MSLLYTLVLLIAGLCAAAASLISFWLIMRHQQNMTNLSVQSKIVGIIWMIPIYSIDSFLGLWIPEVADYVNMLRDCYEAYVLYLFLSLMLSYLNCEDAECEYQLITYLEKQPPMKNSWPLSCMCGEELPKGREFLRYCKFGTLQYCVVRPVTTVLALIMELAGVYHESNLDLKYGYVYILIVMNVSIAYAFIVLASFYSAMKTKLKPYEPVGKFLCIKFVIFFAFWQGVVITGLMKMGLIEGLGGYDARQVSVGMQNFLICIEMLVAAVAFTYTFSYEPFVEGYVNPKLAHQQMETEYDMCDEEHAAVMQGFRNGQEPPYQVDPLRMGTGKAGRGGRNKGLMNMVRSGKGVGFPFSSKPPKADSSGTSYQLVPLPAEDDSHGPVQGTYASPPLPADQQHRAAQQQLVQQSQSQPQPQPQAQHPPSRRIGGHGHRQTGAADRRHEQSVSRMATAQGDNLLNKHFAADSAIRDFNETMPLVVLPSGFEMHRGLVVNSDPEARLRALEEEDRRGQEAEGHL